MCLNFNYLFEKLLLYFEILRQIWLSTHLHHSQILNSVRLAQAQAKFHLEILIIFLFVFFLSYFDILFSKALIKQFFNFILYDLISTIWNLNWKCNNLYGHLFLISIGFSNGFIHFCYWKCFLDYCIKIDGLFRCIIWYQTINYQFYFKRNYYLYQNPNIKWEI
jgi:hypothetical protein